VINIQLMKPNLVGILLALSASLLFSLKPIFIKEAYNLGASSEALMVLRMSFATPFYLIMLFIQRKRLSKHLSYLPAVFGMGFLGYFLSSYLDFLALKTISAQTERVILYAYPSLVVLINACFKKQPPSGKLIFSTLCVYCGLLILIPGELRLTGSRLGLVYMLMCAFSYALFVVLSHSLVNTMGIGLFTSTCMLSAIALTQFHFMHIDFNSVINLPTRVYLLALGLAFFITVLPSYAISAAIVKIGPEKTAITGASGPIFTYIFAVSCLGEALTLNHTLGLMVVILGVSFLGQSGKKRDQK